MYICIFVFMCTYVCMCRPMLVYVSIAACVHMRSVYVCLYGKCVHTHVCKCVHMDGHVCAHVRVCVCMCLCVCLHVHAYTCPCVSVCMCMCAVMVISYTEASNDPHFNPNPLLILALGLSVLSATRAPWTC